MKVTIDMDMTPEEARKFMGLPDVEPLQTAMMESIQSQIEQYFANASDPEALLKQIMPMGLQATEQYTNFYKTIMQAAYGSTKKDTDH